MTSLLLTLPVVLSLTIAVAIFFVRHSKLAAQWVSLGGALINLGVAGLLLADIVASRSSVGGFWSVGRTVWHSLYC